MNLAQTVRGADIVAQSLALAGVQRLFTLSGNQIMPIFDACLDVGIELIHVRHEAAAVHMADAWAKLTGQLGVALLTAGPGHTNGLGALLSAKASESPLLLLSGHAPLTQLGNGAFQELPQAQLAQPLCKAASTVESVAALGSAIAAAACTALSGRPGPVHLSVPFDVVNETVDNNTVLPSGDAFAPPRQELDPQTLTPMITALHQAQRPLILTGPALQNHHGLALSQTLSASTGIPVIGMESPRGLKDPALGVLPELLAAADVVVLLGKILDFSLQFGASSVFATAEQIFVIEPEAELIERAQRLLESRLVGTVCAAPAAALQDLLQQVTAYDWPTSTWHDQAHEWVDYRPEDWASVQSAPEGPLHPVTVCRIIQPLLDQSPDAVLVADGGEFGQWAQACLTAPHRIINGLSGAIGASLSYAIAARLAQPTAPVIAMLGDGTIGFHLSEFDTAIRYGLPFVAVIGNDARWNAEHQIQLRDYGPERLVGCQLNPTRYDQVVMAMGGHGEWVNQPDELLPALQRACQSGLPACVNVMIESLPAPVVRR